MKNSVLDNYAVLAFLFKEQGYQKIEALFEKAVEVDTTLLIAAPNWAEVRYMVERKAGQGKWTDVRHKLLSLPMEIVPADQAMAELAGEIKAFHKMSLADCFAAALAQQRKAEIYTGDPEFRCIEKEVTIIWI